MFQQVEPRNYEGDYFFVDVFIFGGNSQLFAGWYVCYLTSNTVFFFGMGAVPFLAVCIGLFLGNVTSGPGGA